jgi:hypothetical protein
LLFPHHHCTSHCLYIPIISTLCWLDEPTSLQDESRFLQAFVADGAESCW